MTPEDVAAQVVVHLADRSPSLGTGRLVCIDGPSGAGKTAVASALAELVPATLVHTDQLCPGWAGLPEVPGILATLLAGLADGGAARYRAWDWVAGRPGETVVLEPAPLLVVEGVGAGARALAPWTTTLVWLDAEVEVRQRRAIEREPYFRDHWDAWAKAEAEYLATEAVTERADLAFRTG